MTTLRPDDRIVRTLSTLDSFGERIAHDCGLPSGFGEDVMQDAYLKVLPHAAARPGFFDSMPDSVLMAYLLTVVKHAGVDMARRWKASRQEPGQPEFYEKGVEDDLSVADADAAEEIIARVRAMVPEAGLFALGVAISGDDPSVRAELHGVSPRTGRRWFADGTRLVAAAVRTVLGAQLGSEAMSEFQRLLHISQEFAPEGQGLQPGSLWYRHRLKHLSPEARRVVFLFEEGLPLESVIEDIARRLGGVARTADPAYRTARAKVRLVKILAKIRKAFSVK